VLPICSHRCLANSLGLAATAKTKFVRPRRPDVFVAATALLPDPGRSSYGEMRTGTWLRTCNHLVRVGARANSADVVSPLTVQSDERGLGVGDQCSCSAQISFRR
jgi:hypothetical protein